MYRPPGIGAQPRVADLRTPGTAGTAARDRPGRAWDLARLGPSASPTSSSRPTSSCSLRRRALSVAVLAYASARVVSSRGSPYASPRCSLPLRFLPAPRLTGRTREGRRRDPAGTARDRPPGRPRTASQGGPGTALGRPQDGAQDSWAARDAWERAGTCIRTRPGPGRDLPGPPGPPGSRQDCAGPRQDAPPGRPRDPRGNPSGLCSGPAGLQPNASKRQLQLAYCNAPIHHVSLHFSKKFSPSGDRAGRDIVDNRPARTR